MVSMATCIESGARLQMKISYDWTVKMYKKSNSENEKMFLKNKVLRLRPHNNLCSCYYNLTVMWLNEKHQSKKKKNEVL